jgi:hypothetical protein
VGSDVVYRANAIRSLCRIIDVRLSHARFTSGMSYVEKNRALTIH